MIEVIIAFSVLILIWNLSTLCTKLFGTMLIKSLKPINLYKKSIDVNKKGR